MSNFGSLPPAEAGIEVNEKDESFRVLVLGDFAGRANRGERDADEIGGRKIRAATLDDFDDLIDNLDAQLELPVAGGRAALRFRFTSLDGFHANQIYDQIDALKDLAEIGRKLEQPAHFEKTASKLLARVAKAETLEGRERPKTSAGSHIPAAEALDELSGDPAPASAADLPQLDPSELMTQIVAPALEPFAGEERPDPDSFTAAVIAARDGFLAGILDHPDFQSLEAAWRGLDWLLRRVRKGERITVKIADVTAAEFAADLASHEELQESGLHKLLVERSIDEARPWTAVIGLYNFDFLGPHAELLGRMGKLAERLGAPFFAAMSSRLIDEKWEAEGEAAGVWSELRSLPEASFLGLAAPGFLLRMPYGAKTEPTEGFDFEEFSPDAGRVSHLWGNPAFACVSQLAAAYLKQGNWAFRPGSQLTLGDMTMHVYREADQTEVLVCAEARLGTTLASKLSKLGIIPLMAHRDRDAITLGRWLAVASASDGEMRGRWSSGDAGPTLATDDDAEVGFRLDAGSDEEARASSSDGSSGGESESAESAGDEAPTTNEDSSGGESDLDKLMAELGGSDDSATASATEGGGDSDLDKLMAELGGESAAEPAAESGSGTGESDLDKLMAELAAEPAAESGSGTGESDLDKLMAELSAAAEPAPDDAPTES